ncbi:tetratricopeptide repeat protein [bacterium]|nr:tetratricopeptide repeat protein [bacterium]
MTDAAPSTTRWVSTLLAVLSLIVAGLLAYQPLWSNEFISYDDPDYLTNNAQIARGMTWETWYWAWTSFEVANWHPTTWISHLLDVEIFGGVSARGTHLVNLAWHLSSTILLFGMLFRATGRGWPSLLAASLFLLHPLNVESVAWGAQRKGVLSTFFGLACIGAYGSYVSSAGRTCRSMWYIMAVLAASVSLMAKPTWVPLPLFLLLVDVWPLGRWRKMADVSSERPLSMLIMLLDKIPFALMAIFESWITLDAQKVATASEEYLPWSVRILNALSSYVRYLEMMFWPIDLGVLYPHPLSAPPWSRLVSAALVIVGISLLLYWQRRRWPALGLGWMAYLIAQVPTIGFVQVGLQSVADRYAYVSFLGLFVGLSFAWFDECRRWRIPERASSGGMVVLWIVLGGLTYLQAARWHDSITLFAHTAQVTSHNFIAYSHLARAFMDRGDLDRAEYFSERAVESGWRDPLALVSLATFRARQNRWDDAIQLTQEAIRRNPRCVQAYITLAQIYVSLGKSAEARPWIGRALELDPDNIEALRLRDQ